MTQQTDVYISYAPADEAHWRSLENHLALLQRRGEICTWGIHKTAAGEDWQEALQKALGSAPVIVLLLSADFFASDRCYDIEVEKALEKASAGSARLIPVRLRPYDWGAVPFKRLQALPANGTPVVSWPDPEDAWAEIAREIRIAVRGPESLPFAAQQSEGQSATVGREPQGNNPLSEEDVVKLKERYEDIYRQALAARSLEEIRECIREVAVILQYLPDHADAEELGAALRKAEREKRGLRASPKLDTDPRKRLLPLPLVNIVLLAVVTLVVALFVVFLIGPKSNSIPLLRHSGLATAKPDTVSAVSRISGSVCHLGLPYEIIVECGYADEGACKDHVSKTFPRDFQQYHLCKLRPKSVYCFGFNRGQRSGTNCYASASGCANELAKFAPPDLKALSTQCEEVSIPDK